MTAEPHDWRDHSSSPHHHEGDDPEPVWDAARTADPGGLRERLTDALRRWYPESPHHPEAVASAIIAGGLLTPEATAPDPDR